MPIDSHSRSLAKAVSWRVTGTLDTIAISWIVTGKLTLAVTIGAVELFTKILLYYGHERVWNRISYGRAPVANGSPVEGGGADLR